MSGVNDFKVQDGVLTKYCGDGAEVQIPSKIGKETVTAIGVGAFKNLPFVIRVVIPEGVTEIRGMAFSGCTALASVEIPESILRIGSDAFQGCAALTGTETDKCVYLGNPKTPHLVLYKVKNKKRTSSAVMEGTKIVYQEAFSKFSLMETLNLPSSITNFGCEAFKGCKALGEVHFGGSLAAWLRIDMIGAQFSQPLSNGAALHIGGAPLTEVEIPADAVLKSAVFEGCTSLGRVTIPRHVAEIPFVSFCNCTSLEEVSIEDGVGAIGSLAFSGCTSLRAVEIPDSVTKISQRAFMGCKSLSVVTLPRRITAVEEGLLQGCDGLQEIRIPEGVQKIESYAFSECASLKTVEIPKTVKDIAGNAFSGCTQLTIRTPKGSPAEAYANKKGIAVVNA